MIVIVDFGSQTTHLIGRRISELGVKNKIVIPEEVLQEVEKNNPKGIILSGGPGFVNEKGSPTVSEKIFDLDVPVLGICYGQQLTAHLLGGEVVPGKVKEYGPADLKLLGRSDLFKNLPDKFQVWMSHGDRVAKLPKGFKYIATSENIRAGAIADEKRRIYCVQFHPEVQHTEQGIEILKNFLNICGEESKKEEIDINGIIKNIRETVGKKKVVMALSGGTDSFVAAALIVRAIGKNLLPVHIYSGLMRDDALKNVSLFEKIFKIETKIINAKKLFIRKLKNITDPEKKRKTIGGFYVNLFEKFSEGKKDIVFLGQGTTYADFIHSKSTKHAALIKSHHNVGGLPKHMKLKLVEPIRYFYTDQVRLIGKKLGLPDNIISQQPFPGPGFSVRIMGEVNEKRLEKIKQADFIVMEEIEKAGLKDKIFQYFAILTGANSTAIKGDGRFYGEVVAVRAYTTKDRMTADWAKVPYEVLQKISSRIVNEVPGVSRVVYDITTKPPATMEWE